MEARRVDEAVFPESGDGWSDESADLASKIKTNTLFKKTVT